MHATARLIGMAIVGAFVVAGTMAAPAQGAGAVTPVTSGNAAFVIQAPAGVPSDWVSALAPGRVTSSGSLVFPMSSVNRSGTTVALSGAMQLNAPPDYHAPFGISLELDPSTRDMNVILGSLTNPSDPAVAAFFSPHMKITSSVKVNKAKKTRTTTTVWSGDLLLHSGAASDLQFDDILNQFYGVTVFTPGMNLGSVTLTISKTVPCKNAACTK